MRRVYTNRGKLDFVSNVFDCKLAGSKQIALAAPFFTDAGRVLKAVQRGATVNLLVGLNVITAPGELAKLRNAAGLSVRYLTSRFHAKIYIFDDAALLGSANLTDGGLVSNREAVICLDRPEDDQAVDEVKALFLDLWDSAEVLTDEKLDNFARAWSAVRRTFRDPDADIEKAVGRAQPVNIAVASRVITPEKLFLEGLRRLVYEQYRPAFAEVESVLAGQDLRRPELADIGRANETNRFLNWLRLTRVSGDAAWRDAPLRDPGARRTLISEAGRAWRDTDASRVPDDYVKWLRRVEWTFGDADALAARSQDEVTGGLMSLHAFTEQLRFVKGGLKNVPAAFWQANDNDLDRVRRSLIHLIHGPGDFIERLHDLLFDNRWKLGYFGKFSALELFGTIRPNLCPPMNGRMAKALRYIGFDVPGE